MNGAANLFRFAYGFGLGVFVELFGDQAWPVFLSALLLLAAIAFISLGIFIKRILTTKRGKQHDKND